MIQPGAVKLLAQVQLGNSLGDIYNPTSPGPFLAKVKSIWICNTDSATCDLTIRFGTGTLTSANSLYDAHTMAAHETILHSDSELVAAVNAGNKLQGLGSTAAKITVTLFGEEFP